MAIDQSDFQQLFESYNLLFLLFEDKRVSLFFQNFAHAFKAISFFKDPANFTDSNLVFRIEPVSDRDYLMKSKELRKVKSAYIESTRLKKNDSYMSIENKRKFVCKFVFSYIDSDFLISRKIIGDKGVNMIKIVNKLDPERKFDLKLRLRGRGSGFKEGDRNSESADPLQLCVSGYNMTVLRKCIYEVEQLIIAVDKEYRLFCQNKKRQYQPIAYEKDGGY